MQEGESELSDYPGEGEDMDDGDFGDTNQISPTQTSPDRDSDRDNRRSENLTNFMHQA